MYELLLWFQNFVLSLAFYPLFYWIMAAVLALSMVALIVRFLRGR